jgi:type II/III secretion system protein
MNTSIRGKHPIRRILRVATAVAAVVWISANCGNIAAQAPQSSPKAVADQGKKAQAEAIQTRLLEQLTHQIEILKGDLKKQRDSLPANDPHVAQSQETLKALLLLQQQAVKVLHSEDANESTKTGISETIADVLARLSAESTQLQQLKNQLADREKQLNERKGQLATAAQQLAEQNRPPLPPLENGTVKIYRFAYINARDAAKTVESLFGSQSLRVSVDERSNLLVVYGKPDVITALDALLTRLDEQASPNGYEKSTKGTASPRSLMLRVFWLADGVPDTVGQNPIEFLPNSVLAATQKLGLVSPRLVTQTVNSLATGKDDAVDFSTSVPALLSGQPVGMNCEGKLKLVADDRVRVEMGVRVDDGGTMMCDLKGSMATPLGHYMVLGTANSMLAEGGPMGGGVAGGPGMEPAGMGPGARRRFGGEGPAGFRAALGTGPAGAAAPGGQFGAAGPGASGPERAGAAPSQEKQRFQTSRFAFVVQVVEGPSYESEKTKSAGE